MILYFGMFLLLCGLWSCGLVVFVVGLVVLWLGRFGRFDRLGRPIGRSVVRSLLADAASVATASKMVFQRRLGEFLFTAEATI